MIVYKKLYMTPYSFTVEAEIVVVYIEFCRFKFKF